MFNMIILSLTFLSITAILLMINQLISKNKSLDREKLSPFECGFDPLSSSRLPFSMQFYLISIIFLIFDIEIIIFLPIISSFSLNHLMFWSTTSLTFISILLLGLYIEWNEGALTWLK